MNFCFAVALSAEALILSDCSCSRGFLSIFCPPDADRRARSLEFVEKIIPRLNRSPRIGSAKRSSGKHVTEERFALRARLFLVPRLVVAIDRVVPKTCQRISVELITS